MIPASFIQDLLNRVDVVEVVGRYVQLKKGGANYMGLCPFHNEKSPSFTVSPTKQFYHCFGCGAHGTAIGFLIEYSGLGFVEAVKDLAQGVGMTVPEDDDRLPSADRARYQARSLALSDAMTRACDFYRQKLRGSPEAIAYLQGRGLTGEIAARFGIGYAPQGWDGLRAVFEDYDAAVLTEAGLVIEREAEDATARHKRYDRFRHRIMFPIRNSKGQVIGFGGRVLDGGEPKYLNSPETPLFQKGSELYGLFEARQAIREAGYALVTEGYMDVVALAQLGFPQTVATLGTACTSVHVQKLLRQTDRVVFSFDGDRAGQRAARRALEACLPQISDGKAVQFLFLPDQHDPDSYIRAAGGDEFARCINEAMPLSQFLLNEVTAGNDLRTAEGRAQAQFEAKPLLQALAPSALRLQIVRALAKLTLSTAEEIEALFSLSKPVAAIRKPRYSARRAPPLGLEQQILRLLIAQPRLATELDTDSRQAILQGAADGGQMLLQVLDGARELGTDANFAALAVSLQALGAEYDGLIAELAGESENPIELARAELAGAVRQIKMRLLKEETEQLAASGLATEHDKQRFRDLILQQDALRKQGLAETQQG